MKKRTILLALLSFIIISSCETNEPVATAPEELTTVAALGKNPSKSAILSRFEEVIRNDKVIVGQHCGDGADATARFYQDYVEDLAASTAGKYPALVGADFGFKPSNNYPVQTLIDHWNSGGLVTVSWHADNPFTSGYNVRWNSVNNKDKINLRRLLSGAKWSQAKSNYRNELGKVANALKKLKDAGVVVIWRPFHEMNADWFWWGIDKYDNNQTNEEDFKALWRDMYNTFTNTYKLTNLIWAYAPAHSRSWTAGVKAYYPGNGYVDLVGVDYYGKDPANPDFNALSSLGKTVVMCETGPSSQSYGNWDEIELVEKLRGKVAYFLQWHSWPGAKVAIIDNKRAYGMMHHNSSITRDKL